MAKLTVSEKAKKMIIWIGAEADDDNINNLYVLVTEIIDHKAFEEWYKNNKDNESVIQLFNEYVCYRTKANQPAVDLHEWAVTYYRNCVNVQEIKDV